MMGETISPEEFKRRYQSQAQAPAPQKKTVMQKLGSFGKGLGKVFGGDVIGEAVGAAVARGTFGKTAQRVIGGYDLSSEEEQSIQGPSGKAVMGDVLKAGTTIASAALPGAGSLLGKVAQGAAFGYAGDVAQGFVEGEDGLNAFKPGVGSALGVGFPLASKLIGSMLKRGVALTTGAGREVIDRAIHNPDAVQDAVREYAKTSASKEGLVSRAKSAVYDFLGDRGNDFRTSVSKTTFSKPFTKQEIFQSFSDELTKFKGKITPDGLQFNSTTLTAMDQNDLKSFYQQLSTWTDVTPTGIEDLRQAIQNHIDEFAATGNSRASVVLGNLKKFVTSGLEDRAPGYKDILASYGKKTRLAQEVLKELNLKGNAKPSTQLNSVMRIFKKDPQVTKSLVKIMGQEEADAFLNELSGAILSEWLPIGASRQVIEGLGTLGGAYGVITGGIPLIPAIGAAASASPRVVGEIATRTGKAMNAGLGTGIRRAATVGAPRVGQ